MFFHSEEEKSIYYQEKELLEKKAIALYKAGLTLRKVSKHVRRSHEWVRQVLIARGITIDKHIR